ncbi:MAG: hypothetical protein QHH13_13175 [Melioribacter sp.]|uniref:hypothetical protein n=1 Tax=Rosettibacter primus TaxID=3111523 RepID=UPI00247BFBC6|nr:hypothetical protein [Melioribacter sp.]
MEELTEITSYEIEFSINHDSKYNYYVTVEGIDSANNQKTVKYGCKNIYEVLYLILYKKQFTFVKLIENYNSLYGTDISIEIIEL